MLSSQASQLKGGVARQPSSRKKISRQLLIGHEVLQLASESEA